MAVTLQVLIEKVSRLQQGLAEVRTALDELAANAPALKNALARAPPDRGKYADPRTLLPAVDAAFCRMGIDISGPPPSPKDVQALMLSEGVRPEENRLSSGIIAAREE